MIRNLKESILDDVDVAGKSLSCRFASISECFDASEGAWSRSDLGN